MIISEMKEILYNKLQNESTDFKKSDIIIKKNKDTYSISLKGYVHCPFTMSFEEDDYFGYLVNLKDEFEERNIIFIDSKTSYDIKDALIYLGYYIGERF